MDIPKTTINALNSLGFNDLEAAIYAFLLKEEASSGYRIAKEINKPVANTYKSLSTLEQKGALVSNNNQTTVYKAIPLEEYIEQSKLKFKRKSEQAIKSLKSYEVFEDDDGVYEIKTPELLFLKASKMIKNAKKIAVLDITPSLYSNFEKVLKAAVRRKIRVLLKSYEKTNLSNAMVILENNDTLIQTLKPLEFINLIVDGSEFVLGYLTKNGASVKKIYWSKSKLLSQFMHFGVWSELHLDQIGIALKNKQKLTKISDIFENFEFGKLNPIAGTKKRIKQYDTQHES